MSSNPITDSCPGTGRRHRSAAVSTPIAWVSDAAKIADGVIHAAFNHDFSKLKQHSEADRGVIETLGQALAGGQRLGVHGSVRAAPDQRGVVADAGRRQRLAVSGQPVLRRADAQVGG